MKKTISLFFPLLLTFLLSAQSSQPRYSRIKINIENKDIRHLAQLGIEADHGVIVPNRFIINDFSVSEIEEIRKAGFRYEVLIENMEQYYAENNNKTSRGFSTCEKDIFINTHLSPKNFVYGTMAGYYTYEELWKALDAMRAKYPNLISTYQPIDTFQTFEKRPLRWLRISDNPNQEEKTEPKALFTAVHHAREVLTVSQMVYFMWYLLENYDKSTEIKNLLDNTELYFVPMVNPDGYVYNQKTNPNGGGLWRKNRTKHSDGNFGVDLNRNYGYNWGYSDAGSSPNTGSEVYRGKAPFSEGETQALKFLCQKHHFNIILNHHTHGKLLIFPWAYNDSLAHPGFRDLADLLSEENRYFAGTTTETVGYSVNGCSDDWMWGSEKSFAMTPEATILGFWPSQDMIVPSCRELLKMNLLAAQTAAAQASVKWKKVPKMLALTGTFDLDIKRHGFDNQSFTLSLTPLSKNIISNTQSKNFSVAQFATTTQSFNYELLPQVKKGETVKFLLALNSEKNTFVYYDTLYLKFGGVSIVKESGDNLNNWQNNAWGVSKKTYKTAPSALTDSPDSDYPSRTNNSIKSKNYISLPKDKNIILRFWVKWDIELFNDYATVGISTDKLPQQYLCGKYSKPGSIAQLEDSPVYDGKSDWVLEEIDISSYAGQNILLHFSIFSDGYNEKDGIYIDDIEIVTEDKSTSTISLNEDNWETIHSPNPVTQYLNIACADIWNDGEVLLFDALGRVVAESKIDQQKATLDMNNLPNGIYFYQLFHITGQPSRLQKIIKY